MNMNKSSFFKALTSVELDIFNITNKLKELKLNDERSTARTSSTSNNLNREFMSNSPRASTLLDRYRSQIGHSDFSRKIMDLTKMPFIDIPKTVTDISASTNDYLLTLGLRFMEGQETFALRKLKMPDTNTALKGLRDRIGLTLAKDTINQRASLKFTGFTDIEAHGKMLMNRILIEAITYNAGYFGRFLVLVQIGVGCTVWYCFEPGTIDSFPISLSEATIFKPILDYEPFFFNPDNFVYEGFQKMVLLDDKEQSLAVLDNAYSVLKPFSGMIVSDVPVPDTTNITIPESKFYLKTGICLGLVVIVLVSLGISPMVDP